VTCPAAAAAQHAPLWRTLPAARCTCSCRPRPRKRPRPVACDSRDAPLGAALASPVARDRLPQWRLTRPAPAAAPAKLAPLCFSSQRTAPTVHRCNSRPQATSRRSSRRTCWRAACATRRAAGARRRCCRRPRSSPRSWTRCRSTTGARLPGCPARAGAPWPVAACAWGLVCCSRRAECTERAGAGRRPEADAGVRTAYVFSKPHGCEDMLSGQVPNPPARPAREPVLAVPDNCAHGPHREGLNLITFRTQVAPVARCLYPQLIQHVLLQTRATCRSRWRQ